MFPKQICSGGYETEIHRKRALLHGSLRGHQVATRLKEHSGSHATKPPKGIKKLLSFAKERSESENRQVSKRILTMAKNICFCACNKTEVDIRISMFIVDKKVS